MFEKDLYQLIRGLRAHRGNEREYIQDSLKDCRKEMRSNDMDTKASALLKLTYLQMFGHSMDWAAFNVLEVMSSPKYLQKRVGYLAAVQSFTPETDVLMLAENLLKKDLTSPDKLTIALALSTIPHVINVSMANSLLTEILPRLSHSSPAIRKKTIVTLYRLALVYPETLRPAWPKIRERLQDEGEDPSVTAAIVNVVCELSWRRPQDFLPMAPRLFELLTAGGNNWMAIKIIKLFSTLTPLEPRLVKKLLPPLTSLIKTTPAMSLLYECINGIIQGGIMDAAHSTTEGDDIARLCVGKLRAMLAVEGDPNLRYVALLAFAKITATYADLVAEHSDVILECIDDADISIRTRALDLAAGMVNANNLQIVVERLLRQLRTAGIAPVVENPTTDRGLQDGMIPMMDDDEDAQASLRKKEQKSDQPPPLPDDYRQSVIERILEMCSRDTYSNMNDFEWYIGVLVDLVRQCPSGTGSGQFGSHQATSKSENSVSDRIGSELLNVAVRVKGVRPEAAAATQSLLLVERREQLFPVAGIGGDGVLAAAAFVAGEFASMLPDPNAVLTSLTHPSSAQLPAATLIAYLQAIPKLLIVLTNGQHVTWNRTQKSTITLLIARIIHFLEPLTLHPDLEVQERAVEYLDLMRLAAEASSNQPLDSDDYGEPPLLLTQAIPSLFIGMDLNPVSSVALRNVPVPSEIDLDIPLNSNLQMILQQADHDTEFEDGSNEVHRLYHERPSAVPTEYSRPAADALQQPDTSRPSSYQSPVEALDQTAIERKKAERRERYRDDPYYIESGQNSGTSTPIHNILRTSNGEDLDVDAIPVMELKLDSREVQSDHERTSKPKAVRKPKKRFEITSDETLGDEVSSQRSTSLPKPSTTTRGKKSLLEVDSSGLSALSLTDTGVSGNGTSQLDIERRQAEEEEMAKAMKEIERLRLEMQRAQERIQEHDVPEEGTVVKRKKKKKPRVELLSDEQAEGGTNRDGEAAVKKKKKKKRKDDADEVSAPAPAPEAEDADEAPVKVKKKKKRQVNFDEPGAA